MEFGTSVAETLPWRARHALACVHAVKHGCDAVGAAPIPSRRNAMDEQTSKTMKVVWTVVERGQGKSFWTRVGVGFVNRDGSLTLRLDAIPMSGTLQVRDWQEPFERRAEATDAPLVPRAKQQAAGDVVP
jgi:hypothetical protein